MVSPGRWALLVSTGTIGLWLQGCGSRRSSMTDAQENGAGSDRQTGVQLDGFDPKQAEPVTEGAHFPICRPFAKDGETATQIYNYDLGEFTPGQKEPECDISQSVWAKLRCDQVNGQPVRGMRTWCYKKNPKIGCCCESDGVAEAVSGFNPKYWFSKVNEVRQCTDHSYWSLLQESAVSGAAQLAAEDGARRSYDSASVAHVVQGAGRNLSDSERNRSAGDAARPGEAAQRPSPLGDRAAARQLLEEAQVDHGKLAAGAVGTAPEQQQDTDAELHVRWRRRGAKADDTVIEVDEAGDLNHVF